MSILPYSIYSSFNGPLSFKIQFYYNKLLTRLVVVKVYVERHLNFGLDCFFVLKDGYWIPSENPK